MKPAPQKPSFFSHILGPLTGADQLGLEKARLEAFLNAFPGEYCGFHEDGSVAYSEGFCALLGLPGVARVEDVQAALGPGDAAALEGQYLALEKEGRPFFLKVRTEKGGKTLRLRGAAGRAHQGAERFRILWAEDASDEEETHAKARSAREEAEKILKLRENSLNTAPVPVWLRGGDLNILWANEAYTALTHGKAENAPQGVWTDLNWSGRKAGLSPRDMAGEAQRQGAPQSARGHIIVDGQRRLYEVEERPLPGSHYTLGLARDVSREEELETALQRHSTAQKRLLEQLRTGIAIFAADQTLEFYNAAYATQWGLEDQWLNSKPKFGDILEKLRENRRLPEQADFRKYKQGWLDHFTRLIDPHEDMMYLPDGSAVRVLIVPHPMGGVMMTFEDVTSRLQLESSYNTLMAVQRETLDNLAEGVAVFGGDGRLRLWNPAFSLFWKLHPEDLEGDPHITQLVEKMAEFFAPDDWRDARKLLIEQALERTEQEGRMFLKGNVHLRYATVPLPDGGVMVSHYDITDSTRVEYALRERNAALEAAEQLKTDFLANVSYELRTPLNAIMGFSEILTQEYFGPLNDRQKEYAGGIHESGTRLVQLIDDILDLSTIEAGYLELKKEAVDLYALLESLHALTVPWARQKKLQINLSCPLSIGSFSLDQSRFKQGVLNLIRNAITFTPEGGKISIEAEKSGDGFALTIADTGIGIPPDDLERILSPFEKSGKSRAQSGKGAGLGLTLVQKIIVLHGGTLKIESQEKKGTTVRITMPPF
jgi:signal transduction histidine kinase